MINPFQSILQYSSKFLQILAYSYKFFVSRLKSSQAQPSAKRDRSSDNISLIRGEEDSSRSLQILTYSYEFLHILVYRSADPAKRPSAPAKRLRTLAAPPITSQIDYADVEVQDATFQVINPTFASPEDSG
jgi:hypothetical protein